MFLNFIIDTESFMNVLKNEVGKKMRRRRPGLEYFSQIMMWEF